MEAATENLYTIKPRQALDSLKKMSRDPDNIAEVVRFIGALQGKTPLRTLRRFRRSHKGRYLLREKPDLLTALKDKDWLASLPEGTVGHAYYEFCKHESLVPGGLEETLKSGVDWERMEKISEDERFLALWMRDTHDLIHVITGYRTDVIGELSVLAFSVTQSLNPGVMALVALAYFGLSTNGHAQPRMLLTAIARALKAGPVYTQNWRRLLEKPLDEVRRKLRVGPAPRYEPLYIKLQRPAARA